MPWGIYVNGALRHPSQLYEAFLEGVVLFIILFYVRKKQLFQGQLIAFYGLGYSLARYISENYRQPDFQLGFIYSNWTMGQILSLIMMSASFVILIYGYKKSKFSSGVY